MNFTGFTIPDGAFLPPELIYLLPHINGSRLKVLLGILYHNLQFGSGEPVSITDIERMTGLARQSVVTSLTALLQDEIIERQKIGNSFVYAPIVQFLDQGVQKLDHLEEDLKLRESDRELINTKDSLSDSSNLTGLKIGLVKKLRSAGVYLKTANLIIERNDTETIEQHLDYYRHALDKNLAQGPGWLVMSLKENWPAPLGYRDLRDPGRALAKNWGVCMECMASPCHCGDEIDQEYNDNINIGV